MKTHVIRVEPFDDVLSVGDKMTWAQAQRIILVLPFRRAPRFSRLDWVRLERRARALGAQLAVVSRRSEIVPLCLEAGIPVFSSIEAARKERWRRSNAVLRPSRLASHLQTLKHQRQDLQTILVSRVPQPLPWGLRLVVFLLGFMAVLVLMGLLLPSATIEIELPKRLQSVEIPVRLSPQAQAVQVQGVLPCREVTTDLETQVDGIASGSTQWPDTYARTKVVIENLSEVSQMIPKGTIFVAPEPEPVRFEALESAILPAGVGQRTSLAVMATVPGSVGNVLAGAIREVEGALGPAVRVFNPEPAKGGSDRMVSVVSQGDVERVRRRLLEENDREALNKLQTQVKAEEVLIPSSVRLQEILEERIFPAVGEPASVFQMVVRGRFSGCAVKKGDVQSFVRTVLDARIPPGYQAFNEDIQVEWLGQGSTSSLQLVFPLKASRWLMPATQAEVVARTLTGQPIKHAGTTLGAVWEGVRVKTMRLFPSWWGWFPFLPWRIHVILK
ncbi:MAG: baseplate J/gp47 family protein [Thermanaerothrix sp.]|nr:baseplate J/gp47 family protein [Thermanaerothrix sp.]